MCGDGDGDDSVFEVGDLSGVDIEAVSLDVLSGVCEEDVSESGGCWSEGVERESDVAF